MKRGFYKKWLEELDINVPESTQRSRDAPRLLQNREDNVFYHHVAPEHNEVDVDAIDIQEEEYSESNDYSYSDTELDSANDYNNAEEKIEDVEHNYAASELDENKSNNSSLEDFDNENNVLEVGEAPELVLNNINRYIQQPQIVARNPLYEGCPLTREESELLILGLSVRHHITDSALEDIIQVIDCHLPHPVHISKFRVLNHLPTTTGNGTTYYYCSNCNELLPHTEELKVQCNECEIVFDKSKLKQEGNFFLHFPIKEQVIDVMNRQFHQLRRTIDTESDVVSSNVYSKLRQKGVINDNDITIQWNTDGVQVFKSSKVSMWPIQACINELPYRLRKENILLCGLWYGTKKPIMSIFLKPFVDELRNLHEEGILYMGPMENLQPITIKVHTILASADAPARSFLQELTQFNGKFGCTYCLHEGKRVPVGRGHARIYPGEEGLTRNKRQHRMDAEEAVNAIKPIRGVKGPSILMMLPIFSIVSSLPPEYMHNIMLGVTRMFVSAWFNSVHNAKAWCLCRYSTQIDQLLTTIQPPAEISRTPRSIQEMKHWKASEWKNFLLYYSMICITGLLPNDYIQHWFLLVFSTYIFLKKKISEHEFHAAQKALRKFVLNVERLYGQEFMTYNVHILLHVPQFVKKFGALWAWSAFPYEHYNGILGNMFKNSQSVPQQICKSYLRLKSIKNSINIVFGKRDCSIRGREIIENFFGRCNIKKCEEYGQYLRLFDKSEEVILTMTEKILVEENLHEEVIPTASLYKRFIFKNILYHSSTYKRIVKRNNYTIQIIDGSLLVITSIAIVETVKSAEQKYVIFGLRLNKTHQILCKVGNFSSSSFFHIVIPTNDIICCSPEMILKKCVNLPYARDLRCIIPLVNCIETD